MAGLGCSAFARHYLRNHYCFLLLRLLRCFSSARSRILQHTFSMLGCPIRKPTDQFAFADPRGLSQLVASFFASESLGIPRVPFFTSFTPQPFCSPWGCFRHGSLHALLLPSLLLFLFPSNMSKNFSGSATGTICPAASPTVENNGFEPLTPCVQGRCSSQLS